jgi:uncharacterized BrkB/YihY/UPF0761 family membrane protein
MLFKIPKLFGLDVCAEFAAVKNQIDQRIEDIAERAKHVALSTALIIALSTFAGLFLTMAIGVGLIALYQTEAATYGVNLALGIVATVLVVATLILIIVAWVLGRSLSRKRSPELRDRPPEVQDDVTAPTVVPPALTAAMLLGLSVLYRYGPSRRAAKWQWISVGAAFATLTGSPDQRRSQGFLVDYLGDFTRSARLGLPVNCRWADASPILA